MGGAGNAGAAGRGWGCGCCAVGQSVEQAGGRARSGCSGVPGASPPRLASAAFPLVLGRKTEVLLMVAVLKGRAEVRALVGGSAGGSASAGCRAGVRQAAEGMQTTSNDQNSA